METYREFRQRHGSGQPPKPTAEIAERWQNRIIAQGMLNGSGRHGGSIYLGRYGKGIGVQKLVALALCAEFHVFDGGPAAGEMAEFFWETAYEMATGEPVRVSDRFPVGASGDPKAEAGAADPETTLRRLWNEQGVPEARQAAVLADIANKAAPGALVGPFQVAADAWAVFPPHLRPGAVVTMQPTDALHDREYYINNPDYCGQPKRDGCRMVVFATPKAVAWQARSQQVKASPAPELDAALQAVAADVGPFVLDGELWWPDANDGEHRTAAQAATANVKLDAGPRATYPVYAIFECLACALPGMGFINRGLHDLTGCAMQTRFDAAETIAACLVTELPAMTEYLRPVLDRQAKRLLAEEQHSYGREGEVWRLVAATYSGGKLAARNGDLEPIVRTKYLQTRDVRVTGFTATGATKLMRAFAAIEVIDPETGVKLGKVGTGFTQADQQALLDGFTTAQTAGVPFIIEVASQGVTENGILFHPRFVGIKEA